MFAIMLLIMMNSCAATTTTFRSVWKDDTYRDGPLKKVLIIGVDRNLAVKRLLEDELARQMKERGTGAIPSHTVLPEDIILEKEMIAAKIRELGLDAVLVARLIDVEDAGVYETSPIFSEVSGYYGYYLQCCEAVSVGYNVVIETRIFDAKYDKVIWAALSETIFEGSAENVVRSFVPVIIKDLNERRLLQ